MKKRTVLALSFVVVCSLAQFAIAKVPGVPEGVDGATKGIVAVSHPAAAQVGRDILAKGGNAIDAAAGIQLALNVAEPYMSGIGGGGFMLIYLKDQNKITIIDSREVAPAKVTADMFLQADGKPIPFEQRHTSGKAVGVPGTLLGVAEALDDYGTWDLPQVLAPAIELAEKGVRVNWVTADYIAKSRDKLEKYATAAKVFLPQGQPLAEGQILVQPDLAKTLKLIRDKGPDALYAGEIGQALVQEVQRTGGTMTMDDLKAYQVKEREPIRGMFRGYEVISMAPPSSGGLTMIQILKLMEGYNNQQDGFGSVTYLHHLIEANHLAYADRAAYMADEDVYPVPKQGLLHDDYIKERRKLIGEEKANSQVTAGDPWRFDPGRKPEVAFKLIDNSPVKQTTHFSVMDKWGNLVSYTTTIEDVFGSGVMVPGYGFMLNNELTDFDAVPGGVNQVEPGKRPRSSMTPTIVLKDGKPFLAIGSPGGSTIIASVSQTILNVIDHGMSIEEAIRAPRLFSSEYPHVSWEAGIDQDVILQLMAKGHVFAEEPTDIGNVQAIVYDFETGKMYGGADNTREGTVLGVDAIAYTAAEPPEVSYEAGGPFAISVNGQTYPFLAEQKLVAKGIAYVQADKLLLGLGAGSEDFRSDALTVNGTEYLPVKKVAEKLGYAVSWDERARVIALNK
ncbi:MULTISPECIES: gamma-glutamyltransferase [Brevibacillus]|jgi:gamma-glutamyltranspeptidase|uniref:Glutathione hydrolase proenzyme n=1 Tax=Brevibacillus parabrevis TaxID=54914 RepID=A0A4Y3P9G8_BREPA|nr:MULTISPECIES: gamma-glutamyltransferase [Brevibacillus]MDH6349866.1 gamma-glutamyltranspeptidase/glutathione hydrolase [Brevibacillus sp. 1238]RNB94199.1 gamma-glutamyltransferase [Brevibacillus parabrevis]GEB31042.1 gamma-glutamyltranspeptidase [Brevibacillus parabrevis]